MEGRSDDIDLRDEGAQKACFGKEERGGLMPDTDSCQLLRPGYQTADNTLIKPSVCVLYANSPFFSMENDSRLVQGRLN